MIQSRLIQLLKSFDRREMTRFREFSESSYHNKHDQVRSLIGYLSDQFPDFTDGNCDRKELFRQVFAKQSFDYQKIHLVASYATRLAEDFLITEALRAKDAAGRAALLQQLRSRNQLVFYRKHQKAWKNKLEANQTGNAATHYEHYLFAQEGDSDYRRKGKHEGDPHLQEKQDQLDRFYISEKLRDSCEMVIRQRILKVTYQPGLLEAVLQEVEQNRSKYQEVPAVMIYYLIYRLLTQEPSTGLENVLTYVQQYDTHFPEGERKEIYNMLLNYCISHINRGHAEYQSKALRIIRWQLSQELIFQGEYLPEWHYKNIVAIGLRAREFDWVREFIHSYREKLHPESVERAFSFNLASWYYSTGQPEKVLELLARLEYQDPRYYLASKALLLRTYFDLEEYEALRALSEAFQQHMKRNKRMTDERNLALSNLFRFTKKAMAIQNRIGFTPTDRTRADLNKLQQEITESELIIHKSWLLQRMEELKATLPKINESIP